MGKSLDNKVLDRENKTNKISLFAIRYSLFAIRLLVPLLLLPVLTLNAQVIIKEKVEINPQSNVVPDYPSATYTPCRPGPLQYDYTNRWQTIWNGNQFRLDPFQQLFNYQRNYYQLSPLDNSHYYRVEIIENSQYAGIRKLGYYDPETQEFVAPEEIGTLVESVSGLELTGTGIWEYNECGLREKEYASRYVINFNRDIPQNTVITTMLTDLTAGDTKYLHTRIAVPTMKFDDPVSEDTLEISHYYSMELQIYLRSEENWCSSCGGSIPGWVTFTIEITNGQQYGNLYNKNTGERASSFTNIIAGSYQSCANSITDYDFIADGVQPDSLIPAVVKVRCTASDGEIGIWERNIYVTYNDVEPVEEGIIISFSKDHLAPGDTAEIILQRQNTDGSVADFTEWDSFEIGIIEGCGGGKIMVGDSLDTYFSEAYQPIYFIADSTITDTSITVGIRAGLIEGIIGASRMQNNNNQQEEKSDFKRNKKTVNKPVNKTNTQNTVQNNPAASCFGGTIERNIDGYANVVVGGGCDFDNCGDSYDDIQIELLTQPNGFQYANYQLILENGIVKGAVVDVDTITVCELDSANIKNGVVGQSTPVPYSRLRKNSSNNWEKSWILSPCKNDTGAIEYRTITKDSMSIPIYLDFVADVCYDLIAADTSNLTLVNDTTALEDTSIVKDATIAFHDICGHRCYPQIVSKDGYIYKEIVYLHELQHRNHYKEIIDSLKQKYLIDKFKLDFTNDCKTFSQIIKNAESDSSSFESKIKQYVQQATIEYHLQSGLEYKINGSVVVPANSTKEKSNEKKRHSAQIIKNLVNNYLFALHNSRGTPWPVTTCMTCP